MNKTLIDKMHTERKQASSELSRRLAIHREVLGLTNEQVGQLYPALLGRRWIGSLTSDELLRLAARIEAFRSQAELQDFLDAQKDRKPDLNAGSDAGFAWSTNATHIQTLFAPWQPGDGYSEEVISRGEAALGQPFPEPLHSFYRYWGARRDLVHLRNNLVGPHQILLSSNALVVGVENQGVVYWGVRFEDLSQENPPVYWSYNYQDAELEWQISHPHLSDFLDTLTYDHALGGGALHGGLLARLSNPAILDQQWRRIVVPTVPMDWAPDAVEMSPWPIYMRDGQAIECGFGRVATRTPEELDEIAQILDTTWKKRW